MGQAQFFAASKAKAGILFAGGWLWAQSILTLIQIAPGWTSITVLAVTGALGLLPMTMAVQRLLAPHAHLSVDGEGIRYGPGRGTPVRIPWADIVGYDLSRAGGSRFRVSLREPAGLAGVLPWPQSWLLRLRGLLGARDLVFGPWVLKAGLGQVHAACRQVRPDLDRSG